MFLEEIKFEFKEAKVKYLRDFILNNNITDSDTISLHHTVYDEIALDHRKVYGTPLVTPFFMLGILIKSADRDTIKKDEALILRPY